MPSAANAFCASTARLTSEPVASINASAWSLPALDTTYAPLDTPSYAFSFVPSSVGKF